MPVFTRALVGGGTFLRRLWRGSKPKLFGLAFIAVVLGLVGLSIAFYNKDFTKVDMVTLKADRIGRQLDNHADVKIRGLIIGEVRSTSTTDTGATLKLAIDPADMKYVPTNVQARILPKTLFGEKFVDLVVPNNAAGALEAVTDHIKTGAVIPQDESQTAIELASVFDNLLPVLTAVKPADLATTLNEVADALQGQGNALGANLVRTDTYLKGLNPALPALNSDISKLADLADNLNNAAPQVFRMLDVASKESLNVTREHKALLTFLSGTVGVSGEISKVLSTNEANAIELGDVAAPTLETLRTSGQELAYIFQGETALTPRINDALGGQGPFLHIKLSLKADRGAYTLPADCPQFATGGGATSATAVGPNCDNYVKGGPNGEVVVGSPTEKGNAQSNPNGTQPASTTTTTGQATTAQPASYTTDPAAQIAPGSEAEQSEIAALIAPSSGIPASQVPGFADLLFAPQMRGTTVSQS